MRHGQACTGGEVAWRNNPRDEVLIISGLRKFYSLNTNLMKSKTRSNRRPEISRGAEHEDKDTFQQLSPSRKKITDTVKLIAYQPWLALSMRSWPVTVRVLS